MNGNPNFLSSIMPVIQAEIQKQIRFGKKYEGNFRIIKIIPKIVSKLEHNFYLLSVVKCGRLTDPSIDDYPKTKITFKIDNDAIHYKDDLDIELFQNVEHPFDLPIPIYMPVGSQIEITGGSKENYFVLIGFEPLKPTTTPIYQLRTRMPFVYVISLENAEKSHSYTKSISIIQNTKFILTKLIAIQRKRDTDTNHYVLEDCDFNISIRIGNDIIANNIFCNTIFGSPENPFILYSPKEIYAPNSIIVDIETPAWDDNFNRDIYLYFIGIKLTSEKQISCPEEAKQKEEI